MVAEMTANVEFIKSVVDLDSYSRSRAFAGFCNPHVRDGGADFAEVLLRVTQQLIPGFRVASSLNIGIELDAHADQYSLPREGVRCRDLLIANQVVTNKVDSDGLTDFHFDSCVSEDVALNLIRFQCHFGGASGHAFFLNGDRRVIIYPHDDGGLGFFLTEHLERTAYLEMLTNIAHEHSSVLSFDLDRWRRS